MFVVVTRMLEVIVVSSKVWSNYYEVTGAKGGQRVTSITFEVNK